MKAFFPCFITSKHLFFAFFLVQLAKIAGTLTMPYAKNILRAFF